MDDNPGDIYEPDGTGIYEGNDSSIVYDTEGNQHIVMGDEDDT